MVNPVPTPARRMVNPVVGREVRIATTGRRGHRGRDGATGHESAPVALDGGSPVPHPAGDGVGKLHELLAHGRAGRAHAQHGLGHGGSGDQGKRGDHGDQTGAIGRVDWRQAPEHRAHSQETHGADCWQGWE
jgi:hypothetical protein